MKIFVMLFLLGALGGCVNAYDQFYTPVMDARTTPTLIPLKEGEEPVIYTSENIEADIYRLRADHFILVGYSSFLGRYENGYGLKDQAKKVGATVVLSSSKYLDTVSSTYQSKEYITTTSNTTKNIHGNTTYNSVYGGYLGNSNTSGTVQGKTTTKTAIPVTKVVNVALYDQAAAFFVKREAEYKLGVHPLDLTEDQKRQIERNIGAYVDVVLNDTPAFYANVISGDIIIAIDGMEVRNAEHMRELVSNVTSPFIVTVVRREGTKQIEVN